MSIRKKMAAVVPAVAVAVALSGCAPEPAPQPVASDQAAPQASASTSSGAPGGVDEESAKEAGVDLTDLGAPLGTAKVPAAVEDDPEATMTVAFYGLKREGDVLVGTYSFTLESSASKILSEKGSPLFRLLGETDWDPFLIDPVNLNKHSVLHGVHAGSAKTGRSVNLKAGMTYYAYAMFAAPPADVKEMSVALVDGAPVLTGVPVP